MALELGTKIGALIGLGIEGEEGMEALILLEYHWAVPLRNAIARGGLRISAVSSARSTSGDPPDQRRVGQATARLGHRRRGRHVLTDHDHQ